MNGDHPGDSGLPWEVVNPAEARARPFPRQTHPLATAPRPIRPAS